VDELHVFLSHASFNSGVVLPAILVLGNATLLFPHEFLLTLRMDKTVAIKLHCYGNLSPFCNFMSMRLFSLV